LTNIPGWKRMRFKRNKVWASVDSQGNLVIDNNKVVIKYQVDQDYEYKVLASNLEPLDSNHRKSGENVSGSRRVKKSVKQPSEKKKKQENKKDAYLEDISSEDAVCIYTDGASSGNPGPSGIGVWLKYKKHEKSISRYIGNSTNNIAELEAIKVGLSEVKKKNLPVRIFTDSSYAYGLLTLNWKAHKNKELVESIRKLMSEFKQLKLVKVKGHSGVHGNELADQLAVKAVENNGK
jgi:ribonuclease HI